MACGLKMEYFNEVFFSLLCIVISGNAEENKDEQ